ncbi:hypothetical protein AVEN_115147-1 [Araneus ventricosus]|uniref:Uncharacterized protein n=1 Tax=Araneus ventricosus TaxID=182803 RepID=A0A4Y1ZYF0_ARAVE|nr:hypothetical protein AVEN_115147-1 [Araneus ventricosus]
MYSINQEAETKPSTHRPMYGMLLYNIETFAKITLYQIAILVCSKLAASLTRQECKLETTYSQVELAASNSLQTIAKDEYSVKPRIRTTDNPLHCQMP